MFADLFWLRNGTFAFASLTYNVVCCRLIVHLSNQAHIEHTDLILRYMLMRITATKYAGQYGASFRPKLTLNCMGVLRN